MKHLLPEFGLQHLKAIDANQIQSFVNGFAGSSKSQITMIIETLKGIFSYAYGIPGILSDMNLFWDTKKKPLFYAPNLNKPEENQSLEQLKAQGFDRFSMITDSLFKSPPKRGFHARRKLSRVEDGIPSD